MEDWIRSGFPKSQDINDVVDGIVSLLHPEKIYLYNQRINVQGGTTGFKLCIIGQWKDKAIAERDIYLNIDSDVPFDIILYTPEEWDTLCQKPSSFAQKIYKSGMVVYG